MKDYFEMNLCIQTIFKLCDFSILLNFIGIIKITWSETQA